MAEPQWHVSIKGKQRGPFPLDRLKKTAEAGGLPDDAMVWRDGWEAWRPWRDVPILLSQAASSEADSPPKPSASNGFEFAEFRPHAATIVTDDGRQESPAEHNRKPAATNRVDNDGLVGYLTFRRMVTPVVILVVYWIGVAAIAFYGLFWLLTSGMAIVSSRSGEGTVIGIVMFVVAVVTLPISIVMWRVYCEVIAVLFRIYETLTEISGKLDGTRH